MSYSTLCTVCLIASVIVMLIGFGLSEFVYTMELRDKKKQVENHEKGLSEVLQKKLFIRFTPFQVILVFSFLASIPLFYPLYYDKFFEKAPDGWLLQIQSFALSVYNTIRLFVVDADFEIVKTGILDSPQLSEQLALVYSSWTLLFYVAAPIMTAGVVLSFFKETSAFCKYVFSRRANIYILSELNERSLVLARDILRQAQREKDEWKNGYAARRRRYKEWRSEYRRLKKDKANWKKNKERLQQEKTDIFRCRRNLVVFAEVFERSEEKNYELILQAKRLKAICFKRDITGIGLRRMMGKVDRKLYFIGSDENENVRQALVMIDKCRQVKTYNTRNTEFYVFATDLGSEALLNSAKNGKMKVRRGRGDRNLVLKTLWCKKDNPTKKQRVRSIFETAYDDGGVKKINVAIIGLGGYGTELLKTLCELSQMPGYVLNLHVFDKENGEEKLRYQSPELIKYNHAVLENDAYYNIYFHNNVNVREQSFQEELTDIPNLTSVFVTLGDDELNIETAMNVRITLERKEPTKAGEEKTPIYAVVYSSLKTEIFELNDGIKTIEAKGMPAMPYEITFIGDRKSRYSREVVEQTEIERCARIAHDTWAEAAGETPEQIEELKAYFDRYEYYRRSSVSEVLYALYRESLFPDMDEEVRKCYEHKRWTVHMRAEGYVGMGDPGEKNHLAKFHSSLVAYHKLPEGEKRKDAAVSAVKYE